MFHVFSCRYRELSKVLLGLFVFSFMAHATPTPQETATFLSRFRPLNDGASGAPYWDTIDNLMGFSFKEAKTLIGGTRFSGMEIAYIQLPEFEKPFPVGSFGFTQETQQAIIYVPGIFTSVDAKTVNRMINYAKKFKMGLIALPNPLSESYLNAAPLSPPMGGVEGRQLKTLMSHIFQTYPQIQSWNMVAISYGSSVGLRMMEDFPHQIQRGLFLSPIVDMSLAMSKLDSMIKLSQELPLNWREKAEAAKDFSIQNGARDERLAIRLLGEYFRRKLNYVGKTWHSPKPINSFQDYTNFVTARFSISSENTSNIRNEINFFTGLNNVKAPVLIVRTEDDPLSPNDAWNPTSSFHKTNLGIVNIGQGGHAATALLLKENFMDIVLRNFFNL